MAEGEGWLCNHLQYYALAKPMFFLLYDTSDRAVEKMFQNCLFYGAGYTSYPEAYRGSKDIYALYTPLLRLLYRRRWVFENEPVKTPSGFNGNLFVNPAGNLVASIVSSTPRQMPRTVSAETICVNSKQVRSVSKVILHEPGQKPSNIKFSVKGDLLEFDIPGRTIAAVAELITA